VPRKKMGRPVTKFDYEKVEKLASIHCTDEEIAYILDISPSTIKRHKKDDTRLLDCIEKGHAVGRMSIRRAQFESALKNHNATMQIWLGKQYLGQRDESHQSIEKTVNVNVQQTADRFMDELERIASRQETKTTIQ